MNAARHRWILLAILGFCVLFRGVHALNLAEHQSAATVEGDTSSYTAPARALLEHGRFSKTSTDPRPEFLRTPGYPVFIAGVYGLFGPSRATLLLAQVLVSTLTVLLVYLLAARIWSVPIGLLAAALTALDPLQHYTTGTIISECLGTLALVGVAGAGWVAFSRERPALRWPFLLGLAIATATMIRPVTYYLPLLVVGLFAYRMVREAHARGYLARMLVAFLVPVVVILGGWQLRNRVEAGSWRISGIEGKNLYMYRAAGVLADEQGISLRAARHELGRRVGKLGHRSQGQYYGRLMSDGMQILASEPFDALETTATGLLAEVTDVRYKIYEPFGLSSPSGALEVATMLALLGFYALTLYGMATVVRARRHLLAHVFVVSVAAYVVLVSAGPEALGGRGERFRAVVMPILILYAARGAAELWARYRGARSVASCEPATGAVGRTST
jgi:hypothetical protein